MANSLLTGFSGLASHQKMIEVVGNNLANLNTTGFKARRASFSDVFYETVKSASGGTDPTSTSGRVGGSNPAQIGNGSKLSSVAVNFSQGLLEATGAKYDFAVDGDGFFVVNSESGQNYTRAGTFGIDQDGYLVDAATGNQVQRFGTVGEVATDGPAFQTPGALNIQIPIGASVPGQATSEVDLRGNVSPTNAPITNQRVSTVAPLTASGLNATPADLLNNLDFVTTPYAGGDAIQIDGTQHDGAAFSATIAVSDTSTLQDLLDGINAELTGATAQIGADGTLFVEADTGGTSSLDVNLADAPGNTGAADFAGNALETDVVGQDGDVFSRGIEIFDAQGTVQAVGVEFLKQSDGTWDLTASLDPLKGTVPDATIKGIQFNPDGSFKSAGTTGDGDVNLTFHFSGASAPQTISVNFGEPGSFTAMTSLAVGSALSSEQDGFSNGILVDTSIDQTGTVEGTASNGRRFPLAQLAVAMFRNPHGLESDGDNLYRASTNSGNVELGLARSAGRGSVISGQLERSNVDIAVEFTRLIIAQRGFSANARTITVADELQQELTGLIR